jgi:cytochrome c oxidase subunit 2
MRSFVTFFCICDAAVNWQYGFQDPATPIAEGIFRFHHDLMFVLVMVVVFVSWILFRALVLFSNGASLLPTGVVHGTFLEIIWTLVPAFILIIVAIPSFALLYSIDEAASPSITVKIIGHQWYWSYEYSDYDFLDAFNEEGLCFDSYMVVEEDLALGNLRLLEVDNRLVLPSETHVRLIITAADVLHSWSIPSFGVKIDACPGRLNQVSVFIERPGTFYGQCSEICGVNHGFIPIVVEVVSLDRYVIWVISKGQLWLVLVKLFFLFVLVWFCLVHQKNY